MSSLAALKSSIEPTGYQAARRLLAQRVLLIGILLVSLPFSLWGAAKAWGSIRNDVADWLPEDLPATQELLRFFERFGSDELLMIRWSGCELDDPRIKRFQDRLLAPPQDELKGDPFFDTVLTGPEILDFYQSEPLTMRREEAIEKMRRWIVGEDGKSTCLIALVSSRGASDRHGAIEQVYQLAEQMEDLSAEQLWVAGTTMDSVAIDRASEKNLGLLNLGSFSVCLVILLACQRNLRVASVIFLTALYNEQLTLAMIYYLGGQLDSVLLLAANLAFVLSISVGVHYVNYYRDALAEQTSEEPAVWAFVVAATPTALATMTTALGLLSLQVSETLPIARFGFYGALAVVLSAFNTIVLVALHFSIWPLGHCSEQPDRVQWIDRLQALVTTLRWPILAACLAALLVGGLGVQRLRTAVGVHDLISSSNRTVQDYKRLEKTIGPLTPLEVVVETSAGDAREMLKQFRAIVDVHEELAVLDSSFVVLSTATYSPEPPPQTGGLMRVAKEAVFRRKLLANQEKLAALGCLRVTDTAHSWRLTIRCPATASPDYGETIALVRSAVSHVLKQHPAVEVLEVIVAGGVPVVHQTQQQMLRDLIASFMMAFLLVGLALMVIFRSLFAGIIGMLPNLLPCAVTFGLMGWSDFPVELGTILTASAALGIAVDDSMHLIAWFRSASTQGQENDVAVYQALAQCAPAMFQTTLTCTFGLVVFYFSEFLPISKFGLCMFAVLSLALVADLVVLPAILLTPLGRVFAPTPVAQESSP